MTRTFTISIILLIVLVIGLIVFPGCDLARGGASIYVEGLTVGEVSMEGKEVSGLPSQKVSLVLNISAKKVMISTDGDRTIIKASPSDAVIITGPDGISFSGVDPDKIELHFEQSISEE